MVKFLSIVITLILMLSFSGCANENNKATTQNQDNIASSQNSGQDANTQSNESSHSIKTTLPIVSLKDAWNNANIKSIDCVLPDKRGWFPFSMSTDGIIVATVPPQNNNPEEVILYNTINNSYTSIAKLNKDCQHGTASINDKWVVWTESLDQSFLNWKIHVYNRNTNQDKVVFQTPTDSNGNGYPGPEPCPKLYGDEFVWSQPVGIGSNNASLINIKKYNLITNKITDLISQGANPNVTKNFIIWMGKDTSNENPKSALFWNLNNKSEQISTGDAVEYFANNDDSVVWSGHKFSAPDKWAIGLIENGKEQLLLESDNQNALQFLTMSSRLIAWTEYYKVQVYDRKLKKIVTLQDNDASYSSTFTNENYLYWTTPLIQDSNSRDIEAKKNGIYLTKVNIINLNELK